MIGTPNYGAERAEHLHRTTPLFGQMLGPAAVQLVVGEEGIIHVLPKQLEVDVGILAGGRGKEHGFSRTLEGDNDGTVRVASTRLAGAKDFKLITGWGGLHTLMVYSPRVHRYTATFLQHGYFCSPAECEPIEMPSSPIPTPATTVVSTADQAPMV
jgi:hypothetical protein